LTVGESACPRFTWVTFLSDYGLDDVFVGVCKGVMAQRAPYLRILDICHLVEPQDVRQGATVLASAMAYLPPAVHLALVDPMYEGLARGVVVETLSGSVLVGPDNGVLSLAWTALGGIQAAFEIANPDLWLPKHSRTFRGRDVFAPVVAAIANGESLASVGPPVGADDLTRIRLRQATIDDDHVHGEVYNVDHFGNLSLNVARADLEAAGMTLGDTVELRCSGRSMTVPFRLTYGDVPPSRLALCEDSFRSVMIAVNLGSAARSLRVGRGDPVVISRVAQPARRSTPPTPTRTSAFTPTPSRTPPPTPKKVGV
jgi:S-adenosyl-L-methionine hydrolase (adenosine-forming)